MFAREERYASTRLAVDIHDMSGSILGAECYFHDRYMRRITGTAYNIDRISGKDEGSLIGSRSLIKSIKGISKA